MKRNRFYVQKLYEQAGKLISDDAAALFLLFGLAGMGLPEPGADTLSC